MTRAKRIRLSHKWVLVIGLRDGWRCHICNDGYKPNDPWEIDHDVPLSRGGKNHLKNLKLAHKECNRDIGAHPK